MTTKTSDTREPLCELFYTPEELDEEFIPENSTISHTSNDDPSVYSLHQQAFFSHAHGETMDDWNKYVESNPELVEVRNKYQEIL